MLTNILVGNGAILPQVLWRVAVNLPMVSTTHIQAINAYLEESETIGVMDTGSVLRIVNI